MNLKSNQKGFTIVELLIVIVVIAILAAISIVAYVGIQNNARASERQSDAANIAKVAETIFAESSEYPTETDHFANATNAKLPANVAVSTILASTAVKPVLAGEDKDGDTKQYQVKNCGANVGGIVYYHDPRETGDAATKEVVYGRGC